MDADAISTERGSEMHKLGEQWVEEIDGKKHMLKAVKPTFDRGNSFVCTECIFAMVEADYGVSCFHEDCKCPLDNHENKLTIKDLGILNEDGCLKSDFGIYPAIYRHVIMGVNGYMVKACATDPYVGKYAWGKTKQEAIDAWNRRV